MQSLESLTEKQREDTLNLMEMFNIPIEEANRVMSQAAFNLDVLFASFSMQSIA